MGVPVEGSGRPRRGGGKRRGGRAAQVDPYELFTAGQEALFQEDYDRAKELLQRAVQLAPENAEFVDAYGAVLAEAGPRDEAVRVLQRAVELAPDEGFEKFMYLGQLLPGEEGIASVRKGVSILEAELATAREELERARAARGDRGGGDESGDEELEDAEEEVAETADSLASALVALAELQLAAGGAEQGRECEELLQRAHRECPDSSEPLQALAALRCEQGRREQALELLKQSMALWYKPGIGTEQPGREQGAAEGDDDDEGAEEGSESREGSEDGGDELPEFGQRLQCAKLLLELDDTTATAIDVCESCLLEDEESLEATLLLAVAQHAGGEVEAAGGTLEDARALAEAQGLPAEHPLAAQLQELGDAIRESREQ